MNVIWHHNKGIDEIPFTIEKQQAVGYNAGVFGVIERTTAHALIHPLFKL